MRAGDNFCPGILKAVPAKDGLLLRIRIPGGLIEPAQLRAISRAASMGADGQVEITSRANIQVRALTNRRMPAVTRELTAVGLLPSPAHDRVRNIMASPLAGLDAEELFDTTPLVRLLDLRLRAEPVFAELHPKFSMALDGGGRWFSGETDDLALRAFRAGDDTLWHLFVGGVATRLAVPTANAVDCLLEAARFCLRHCSDVGVPARGRVLAEVPGSLQSLTGVIFHLTLPCAPPQVVAAVAEVPVGIDSARDSAFSEIVPSIPLGRLSAMQASEIAAIAARRNVELRLAPWRGIVIGLVPRQALPEVVNVLRSVDLSTDESDGYRGVSACAGIDGCDASLADVRGDAAALARVLAGRELKPGWTVHISGCEKQCAMRTRASAKLVAGETGYRLTVDDMSVSSSCSSRTAIHAIAAHHGKLPAGVNQ